MGVSKLYPFVQFSSHTCIFPYLQCKQGCAFMYVAPEHKKLMTPLSVTHGMRYGFSSSFIFGGTRDYSAWLSLLAGVCTGECHLMTSSLLSLL